MKPSLLLGIAATIGICSTPAIAQQTSRSAQLPAYPVTAPESSTHTPTPGTPASASAQPVPLTLRNGAVATGLSGFYDYQSNGVVRGRIIVPKNDPQKIYAVYMLATDGTNETTLSDTRRVGYAYSTDGGTTWSATREIDPGFRLGYPYIDVTADGVPYIATHGDPDGQGTRTMVYTGEAGSTFFARSGTYPRQSILGSTGDQGAGVIWPAFVIHPTDPSKHILAATLSAATQPIPQPSEPVHVNTADLGSFGPWGIIGESDNTTSSGGRNILATSASGKVGMAYYHFGTVGAGIYYTESNDGGISWSSPTLAMGASIPVPGSEGDTLETGVTFDFVYNGDTPIIAANANLNTDGQRLFVNQGIYCWTPATGVQRVAGANADLGIGITTTFGRNENGVNVQPKVQPNMPHLAYPSISVGDDGRHVVITFQAAAQYPDNDEGDNMSVVSEDQFYYYRLWAVGSADGGATWHDPRVMQDFAGNGTDSASIEYPTASAWGRMVNGNFEHSMVYHARRFPGMYAFVVQDVNFEEEGNQPADRGPINETFQYFQRTMIDPTFFGEPASVNGTASAHAALAIERSYPNPTNSAFTVEYQLPASGQVSVRIYNALGAEVLAPVIGQMQYSGGYTKSFDVSSLPAGQYRVVVEQNGRSASQGMTVIR